MRRVCPKRSLKKTLWTLLFGFSTIILFQNCSSRNNADVMTVDDVQSVLVENLPFAFEAKVDQIAYMSCSGQYAAGHGSAFTFKVGGYGTGSGIRLRDNYLSATSSLNSDAQVKALNSSPRNTESGAILSLRERNYLQDYYDPDESSSGEVSYAKMMFEESMERFFSSEHYAKRLLALGSGNYINYMPGLAGFNNKTFDGALRLATNSGVEYGLRDFLMNSYYLTVAFPAASGDQTGSREFATVRSPYGLDDASALTSVFGLGYVLSFQQFDGRMATSPARTMSVDYAVNLENQTVLGETWDCSEKFVIVRPEDASRYTYDIDIPDGSILDNEMVCEIKPDYGDEDEYAAGMTPELQKRWDRIRNVLPIENWYVTLPKELSNGSVKPGCIVPKTADFCYDMEQETGGVDNENIRIAYYYNEDRSGSAWSHTVDGIEYTGKCGSGTLFVCPHYVTICYKTSSN